jgi:CRISPR system Cascade subunit CasB
MSAWLEILRGKKEDRGLMAALRCYLVESKKNRAYPALHYLGISVDSESEALSAALYAMHPMEDHSLKNFGTTVRRLEMEESKRQNASDYKLTPIERKFQHLLCAEPGREIFERVTRFVMMAKAKEKPVNYEQLQKDMHFWSNWIRSKWAMEFWETPSEIKQETSGDKL